MLEQGGLTSVTVEGLATRSGVSKPTIYRYWKNAHTVAMEAFLQSAPSAATPRRSRTAIGNLRAQLHKVAETFTTTAGRSVAAMVAASQSETELAKAFRTHFILASREEGRKLLLSAVEEGDIRAGIDFDVTLDLIYAPLYFRLLMGHARLTREFADAVLHQVLDGIATTRKREKRK
ncbi:MAG: TetR/AcrR family transcriptional regulator C-terminal ligand-binding domain-containing protein [Acidobacteria bacterium]|nr:TetR/AcrR family transcriptional regulator C-terminal ligand-binding domain-containing protein [Acidobacteriota bacterium]